MKNSWNAMFSGEPTFPSDVRDLTDAHKGLLQDLVECDLSPENLCQDGEAHPRYVERQRKHLEQVLVDLESVNPSVEL